MYFVLIYVHILYVKYLQICTIQNTWWPIHIRIYFVRIYVKRYVWICFICAMVYISCMYNTYIGTQNCTMTVHMYNAYKKYVQSKYFYIDNKILTIIQTEYVWSLNQKVSMCIYLHAKLLMNFVIQKKNERRNIGQNQ